MDNPFSVITPEVLAPKSIANLFVDVFSDFPKIKDNGHTFIHGPRGTGKSMMFRYLEPVVQNHATGAELNALPFFAVHVPIKAFDANEDLTLIENLNSFNLEEKLQSIVSENLLIFHATRGIFSTLRNVIPYFSISPEKADFDKLDRIVSDIFLMSGIEIKSDFEINEYSAEEFLRYIAYLDQLIRHEDIKNKRYIRVFLLDKIDPKPYTGSVCTFLDFLTYLCEILQSLSFMPKKPFYLMIDDADNMPVVLQKILNSWVYSRTTQYVCLKISTQLNYQTYKTTTGFTIESPHDFSEIDISTVYTSNKNGYYNKIKDITEKRLRLSGIDVSAEEFFDTNLMQESAIEQIKRDMRAAFDNGRARGGRRSDDAARYARPEYMRSLAGSKKNTSSYSYAGFRSLVDLSSGIIRNFLDLASLIFNTYLSRTKNDDPAQITKIPYQLQDEAILEWSERYINDEFEKLQRDEPDSKSYSLRNLIESLGKFFRYRILDATSSERRLISIMVRQDINRNTENILKFGVRTGYLHTATITDKNGLGKRKLYILNRRLAPYFKIDPSGYAAHLSVTENDLLLAFEAPDKFVNSRSKGQIQQSQQDTLFDF